MRTFSILLLAFSVLACSKEAPRPTPGAVASAGLPPSPSGATAPGAPPAAAAPAAGETGAAAPSEPAGKLPAGHPPTGGSAAAGGGASLSGSVVERIDAPPYSYLRLDTGAGGEQWAAVPKTEVKKGDRVTVVNATPMDGFESKTLKRRFDHIFFGNLEGAAAAAPAPAAAPDKTATGEPGREHTASAPSVTEKIPPAQGPGAMSIADLYAKKASLVDQTVAVRGKVVKYNGGIMGKNWLHMQDGSGTAAAGNHDIAVTSTDEAQLGEIVTVRGTVHTDRDFGAGYSYSVIIEDAKIAR